MATKKQVLKINDMHCTSCSLLIDGDLEETRGVISANTNYAKQITEVTYNEDVVKIEEIIEVIKKAGYDAQFHK